VASDEEGAARTRAAMLAAQTEPAESTI
jgi:hypothetical protein